MQYDSNKFDLVVIGSGADALVAARQAARRGLRVAVVESSPRSPDPAELRALDYALRQAARHLRRRAEHLPSLDGEECGRSAGNWLDLLGWIRDAQQRIIPVPSADGLAAAGIQLLVGQPAFVSRDTLMVGQRLMRFRRAIIANSLRWAPPALDGLPDQAEGLTAQNLLHLDQPPEHLAILGTGPRACLWGQAFCRLGSDVCLVGQEKSILVHEEPTLAALVQQELTTEGVQLLLGCDDLIVDRIGSQRVLVLEREGSREKRLVDRIFWEQPLESDLEGLQLEAAGVAFSSRGVEVDDRLRTTNRRILGIGAICGEPFALPEMAEAMAVLAVRNAFSLTAKRFNRERIPRCLWTDPEIIQVGWTPAEAAERQITLATYRADNRDSAAAVLDGEREGFVLMHVERGSGRVAGVTLVGDRAGELSGAAELLVASRSSLAVVAELVPCRPTRFELFEQIAHAYREDLPRSRWRLLLEKAQAWWDRLLKSAGTRR